MGCTNDEAPWNNEVMSVTAEVFHEFIFGTVVSEEHPRNALVRSVVPERSNISVAVMVRFAAPQK
jgi:hypothetical protein